MLIIIGSLIIGFLIALAIMRGASIISEEIQKILKEEIKNSRDSLEKSLDKNIAEFSSLLRSEIKEYLNDEKTESYLNSLGDSLGKSLGKSLGEFARQTGEEDLRRYKKIIKSIQSRPEALLIFPFLRDLDLD